MTSAQAIKEIHGILNVALVPTIRIEYGKRKEDTAEYPMSTIERVQWLADEYRDAKNELQNIADDAAGEDL